MLRETMALACNFSGFLTLAFVGELNNAWMAK
ncbi:hypothetical protein BDA96_06G285300 [Sorghum bicolor]|uniref:Uncharacterized protein n=1 Tax=Sorghum bicolor TaxID=4558 RepID=A0A921QVJ2_SORBI|nr:hypothetical protein BDA96_06G285300 [Sorghum bicolor]